MVLVKMLMEIDPLPMRGSMVMILPPGGMFPRQNSSAGALDWFRLETAAIHPEIFLMIFPRVKDTIYQKMGIGGLPGGPRGRGHA